VIACRFNLSGCRKSMEKEPKRSFPFKDQAIRKFGNESPAMTPRTDAWSN